MAHLTGGGLVAASSVAAQRISRQTKDSSDNGWAPEPHAVRHASSSLSPATLCTRWRAYGNA